VAGEGGGKQKGGGRPKVSETRALVRSREGLNGGREVEDWSSRRIKSQENGAYKDWGKKRNNREQRGKGGCKAGALHRGSEKGKPVPSWEGKTKSSV